MTIFQIVLSFFTFLCTTMACIAAYAAGRNAADAEATHRAIHEPLRKVNALADDVVALDKRITTLYGRVYREQSRGRSKGLPSAILADAVDLEAPGEHDVDPELQAMIDFQRAT